MTVTTTLATQTPPEIDTQIAELYYRQHALERDRRSHLDMLHDAAGDRKVRDGRRYKWQLSDRSLVDNVFAGTFPASMKDYRRMDWDRYAVKLRETDTEIATTHAEMDRLQGEYAARGGWSRFFLVQNNNGHIHSSMQCSTCFATTQFGWLPALSGLTEKDAVDAHGTILCSICFPTAPVEWTVGKQAEEDPNRCPGSGEYAKYDDESRKTLSLYRPWAVCPQCQKGVSVTSTGKFRKHKKGGQGV